MGLPRKRLEQAKTVAMGCDQLPGPQNGKECHEGGPPPVAGSSLTTGSYPRGGPTPMLHAGLDLSRRRLGFHLLDVAGETVEVGAAPPDADGLRGLAERVGRHGPPVRAAIESMNGARFVRDELELHGWE